jgi:hypothetical protein
MIMKENEACVREIHPRGCEHHLSPPNCYNLSSYDFLLVSLDAMQSPQLIQHHHISYEQETEMTRKGLDVFNWKLCR